MQDKMKRILIITVMFVFALSVDVFGYTGNGKKDDPFVVTSGTELEETMTKYSSRTSWIYIAISDTVAIKKTITVKSGKYRIYAKNKNQILRRSASLEAAVNDSSEPKYCMVLESGVMLELGYDASNYKLNVEGKRDVFENKQQCNSWLRVKKGAILTLDVNCHFKNAIYSVTNGGLGPIYSEGTVNVDGEISNCRGRNGGAIMNAGGTVVVNSTAKIHNCTADTEGGAIFNHNGAKFTMNGGLIYECTAAEEGGAVSIFDKTEANIQAGKIYNNKSGETGGGIHSSYGSKLQIGTSSGTGPEIYGNKAGESGGGIRCNGGTGDNAGGNTIIKGGKIYNNTSEEYGGGISVGKAGANGYSYVSIENLYLENNTCKLNGGGIWLSSNATSADGNSVKISNCKIRNNHADGYGGGVLVSKSLVLTNNEISGNYGNISGGVHITSTGICTIESGTISSNTCTKRGSGICVNGRLLMKNLASLNTNNVVYLPKDKYIELTGKINRTSGYVTCIKSEVKDNGTILIKVNYSGGKATDELYYTKTDVNAEYKNANVLKKYKHVELGTGKYLRPTENVNGYGDTYIIISEKYTVSYDKNADDTVYNLPESQGKFWKEDIKISDKVINRRGCAVDNRMHWNTKKDGTGTVTKPGTKYSTDGNVTLYAQWLSWQLHATNRYYVVGQNIIINAEELFKKIKIFSDDDISGMKFVHKAVYIENGRDGSVAMGDNVHTENYINTDRENVYEVTFRTQDNINNIYVEETMLVYVIDAVLEKGRVRYVSTKYINTLDSGSKWRINLKSKLNESLQKTAGQGLYKIQLNNSKIKDIKNDVKKNGYKIFHEMNRKIAMELSNNE